MKRTNLLAAARLLLLTVTACFVLAADAGAQERAVETGTPAPPQSQPTGATADEDFELNIDLRRISEADFHAETAVEAGDSGGLRLKVGVALRASDIEVLLRNVRGRVRFRASLAPVLRLLDARRGTTPPTAQPTPP